MTLNQNWGRVGGEARTEEYRTWRTTLGVGAVGDIDQVEYNATTGCPRAFIELCVADMVDADHPGGIKQGGEPSQNFFAAVEAKVANARPQGRMTRYIARRLNIPVYLVVYIYGHLDQLWLKQLGTGRDWLHLTTGQFEKGLSRLHRG